MDKIVHTLIIRESHLDTFGHVNNATYLALFEEARWEEITRNGYGHKEIMKEQKGPIILDAHLKFLAELRLREEISITLRLLDYDSKVGHLLQKILKKDGTVAAELMMTFGFFDLRTRKLIAPTPAWKLGLGMNA